jgi:hypothetical protein
MYRNYHPARKEDRRLLRQVRRLHLDVRRAFDGTYIQVLLRPLFTHILAGKFGLKESNVKYNGGSPGVSQNNIL